MTGLYLFFAAVGVPLVAWFLLNGNDDGTDAGAGADGVDAVMLRLFPLSSVALAAAVFGVSGLALGAVGTSAGVTFFGSLAVALLAGALNSAAFAALRRSSSYADVDDGRLTGRMGAWSSRSSPIAAAGSWSTSATNPSRSRPAWRRNGPTSTTSSAWAPRCSSSRSPTAWPPSSASIRSSSAPINKENSPHDPAHPRCDPGCGHPRHPAQRAQPHHHLPSEPGGGDLGPVARQLSDGRTVGYRSIRGGRTLRVPLLERVAWMELNTIPIEVSVQNAYSAGAIPLNVQGIANVKVSSVEGLLQNSVERFLEVPQAAIAAIAKETLEANLRGVLATLTPEEVNEDRLKFAQTLMDEADDDIKTLGLELDVLKIQNVTDEVGYLDSVGRRQTAEVLKEARVAEALRRAESEESEALGRQRGEIATAQAELMIVEEQNALRVRQAQLEALARAAEAEAKVAGEKARVVAEQTLEAERVELETRRLEADVVAPARADLEAEQLEAKADAAKVIEEGNAQVEVFRRLVDQYHAAGEDAQRIFVLRMLPDIIDSIVGTVSSVDIEKVSIIDSGGQGGGVPGSCSSCPAR